MATQKLGFWSFEKNHTTIDDDSCEKYSEKKVVKKKYDKLPECVKSGKVDFAKWH